ncbi:hypothetical protein K9M78_01410 [Candidatus Bipolaricaulota bacterium]|nr:hypothetical protein [Candidatus Bipolaricaulota bacterium]
MVEWEEIIDKLRKMERDEENADKREVLVMFAERALEKRPEDQRSLNENLKKLFERILPKNKRKVFFDLIKKVAYIQKQLKEEGFLASEDIRPLTEAADLALVSTRQYRKYLKGTAIPSAKKLNNAFDNFSQSYRVSILYHDLLDRLKLIYDEFPDLAESSLENSSLSPAILPSGWGEEGLGNRYMTGDPRYNFYQEDGEYILEYEGYGFTFSTIKFKADEEDIKDFFDSEASPFQGDWGGFKEKLDSTSKKLPRLEGNPDLSEYVWERDLVKHMREGTLESIIGDSKTPPFAEDMILFSYYRAMIQGLEEGQEDSDIFRGYPEKEIERILEFAEQLDLNEEKKSELNRLLNEGKEDE